MEEGKVTETQKHDLLSMMLYERDEYFTDQLVKDSAFTFLFAGHETTATGLPGVLMYFAKVLGNLICISTVFKSLDFFLLSLEIIAQLNRSGTEDKNLGSYYILQNSFKTGYYFHYHSPRGVQEK